MSPITESFEGQSRNRNGETYWGSGKSSLAEGSWDEEFKWKPMRGIRTWGPPCQASVSLGQDSLFLSCHPSLLRLLLVPKTGLS